MSQPVPIRVLVVDDHQLAQKGMDFFLAAFPDLELVGAAGDGADALLMCERLLPDVVLMDVKMPGLDGIATTRQICARFPEVRVIMLSSFDDAATVREALKAGARGYLLKSISPLELAQAVRAVYHGRSAMSPEATDALVQAARGPETAAADLTPREREVLRLLMRGCSNQRIAEELMVSRATVKFHMASIMTKLGVTSRAEAIAAAYQRGLC
jgi:NarL family two-component system response regulator LiaR